MKLHVVTKNGQQHHVETTHAIVIYKQGGDLVLVGEGTDIEAVETFIAYKNWLYARGLSALTAQAVLHELVHGPLFDEDPM